MLQLNFWISELAERTGVSTRTIRYYIEEGLLPQPEVQGKYAVFNEDYLIRLQLIKYLKEAYLPLKEIKRRLEDLQIAEMQELVALFQQDPAGALAGMGVYPTELGSSAAAPMLLQAEEQNGDRESAREYIQRALQRTPAALRESPPAYQPAPAGAPVPTGAEGSAETWQRVELAPGVELHVRQPQGGENAKNQQVDELIHLARKIFTKQGGS